MAAPFLVVSSTWDPWILGTVALARLPAPGGGAQHAMHILSEAHGPLKPRWMQQTQISLLARVASDETSAEPGR